VTSAARPATVTDHPDEVATSRSSAWNATISPSTLRATVVSAAVRSTISAGQAKFIGRTVGRALTVKISRPTGTRVSNRSDRARSSRVSSPSAAGLPAPCILAG
jgi:hypothetical protein